MAEKFAAQLTGAGVMLGLEVGLLVTGDSVGAKLGAFEGLELGSLVGDFRSTRLPR